MLRNLGINDSSVKLLDINPFTPSSTTSMIPLTGVPTGTHALAKASINVIGIPSKSDDKTKMSDKDK